MTPSRFAPNLNINAKNLPCLVFGICYTCACRKLRVQVDSCVHIVRVSLASLFQKKIYLLIKSYVFHFNISQVNIASDWALNQPWVLEFSIIGEWGLNS